MDRSIDPFSLRVESTVKCDLELDDIVNNAEKSLKSEAVKANEKRRSQLIVLGSSSEGSMKSIDFGSATLSSINNSMSGSNIQSGPEDCHIVQDLNPTLLDDIDISSLADISEELISISSNSSISLKVVLEKLAMRAIEKSKCKSVILNSTIEINSELLSSEAKRIISCIEAKNHSKSHFKNESLEVLDLERLEGKLSTSASFNVDFGELQDPIVMRYDCNTVGEIVENSIEKNVLMFEAQKVINAAHADYLNSCQNPCIDDYEILDLDVLNNYSLMDLPEKDFFPDSNKIIADNTTHQMSTPVLTKEDREKIYKNIVQLLSMTAGRLKDFKLSSPFCDASSKECETYQNATFNRHNCNVDPTSQLPNLNGTFEVNNTQDICNKKKCVNGTFDYSKTNYKKKDDYPSQFTNLNCTFEKKIVHDNLNLKKQVNTTFDQIESLQSFANDKEKIVDETFLQAATPINSTFDHNDLNVLKDEKVETKHNGTFIADTDKDNLNNTFEIVGNGNFIIKGEVTNLIDMESTALQTVLHCTPVQAVKLEQAVTPVYRRNSSCQVMKKQSFMNRLSLAGALPSCNKELSVQKQVVQNELCNKTDQQETSSFDFCPLLKTEAPICKDNLLNKLRKNTKMTSGYSGPVKAIPFKTVSECGRLEDNRKRAISTPIGVITFNGSGSSSIEKKDIKFPSLPSFGSVSSIDERPNTFDAISDGSLGTPEVFRRQISREGPAITSTPAMNSELKYSMIPKGLCENNVPTPIVAPKEIRNIKEVMNINRCSSSDPYIQGGISTDQEVEFERAFYEDNKYPLVSNENKMEEEQLSSHPSPKDPTKNKKNSFESKYKEFEMLGEGNNSVKSNQINKSIIKELTVNLDSKTNGNGFETKSKFTRSLFSNQRDTISVDEVLKTECLETNAKSPVTQNTSTSETCINQEFVSPSEVNQSDGRSSLLNEIEVAKSFILNHEFTSKKSSDDILTTNESLKINVSFGADDAATDLVHQTLLNKQKMLSNNKGFNGTISLDSNVIADEHEFINSSIANIVESISEPLENVAEIAITVAINKKCLNSDASLCIDNGPKISETEEKTSTNRNIATASNCRTVKKQNVALNLIKANLQNAGVIGTQPPYKLNNAKQPVKGGQLSKTTLTSNCTSRRTSTFQKFPKPILCIKNQEAESRAMQPGNKKKETSIVGKKSTIVHKKDIEIKPSKLKAALSSDIVVNKTSAISMRSDFKKKLPTGLKVPIKVATANPLQSKSVNSTSNFPKNSKLKYWGQSSEYDASKVVDSMFNLDKAGSLEKLSSTNKENFHLLPPKVRPSGIRRPASNIPRMNYK